MLSVFSLCVFLISEPLLFYLGLRSLPQLRQLFMQAHVLLPERLRRLAPTYRFYPWSMLASVFLRYSVFRCDAYASFCFGICCLHRAGVVDFAIVSAASEHSAFVQVLPCVSGTHSLCATEVIKLRNSDAVFSVL